MKKEMSCGAGSRFAGKFQKQIIITAIVCMVFGFPGHMSAESLTSPNYRLENPEFDNGGGLASSTNYQSQTSAGGSGQASSSSANYKTTPGFEAESYPGVPGKPTLTNTGGGMYNTLDFVVSTGGDHSDVNYAIAISTDNFASTTNFVQSTDTIGPNVVWQTYTGWGAGVGQRLVGLVYNTTYTIKVKARYGPDSETAYSLTTSASTTVPSLSVVIAGVNTGTVLAGQTTNITTTATSVSFSTISSGQIKVGAQQVTVSTNANGGYSVGLYEDHDLSESSGTTIAPVSGTNASPAPWPATVNTGAFGYHTTDGALCSGVATRFSTNDTYAAATTAPAEVICNTGPANSDVYNLLYKVQTGSLQSAGVYTNHITYVTTASY